jgi:hypothetical protein
LACTCDLSREAQRVRGWFAISIVDVWHEVSLAPDLLVEVGITGRKPGRLLETIPFLRSLSVSMGPPL